MHIHPFTVEQEAAARRARLARCAVPRRTSTGGGTVIALVGALVAAARGLFTAAPVRDESLISGP